MGTDVGTTVVIDYTNYRGERADREVRPLGILHGSNEWHPQPGYLLLAHDVEKGAERLFSMRDIHVFDKGRTQPDGAVVRVASPVAAQEAFRWSFGWDGPDRSGDAAGESDGARQPVRPDGLRVIPVSAGDWVVRSSDGEIVVVDHETFDLSYQVLPPYGDA